MSLRARWEAVGLLEKLAKTGAVQSEHMAEGTALTRLLFEVGLRIEQLEKTVKTRDGQIEDLKDYVVALQKERDDLLSQLMQVQSMKGAAE